MKCCKKKRKYYVITFVMLMVYLMSAVVCYAEGQPGTYYMIFGNSEENHTYIELGQQQTLYTNNIDLTNLEFLPLVTSKHYSITAEASDLETLTVKARELLLRKGYAKLINLDIATDGEKKNQQYAQEEELGIWAVGNSDKTKIINLLTEKWKALCLWGRENKELIMSSIVGCGILAFIGRVIIRFLRTRKKIIFFGGANAAGKTTMSRYLINPDASKEDLLNQEPSQNLAKERIIRDDTNRKLTLKACLLDTPGHELGYVIDELSLTLRARVLKKRYVVIIMVAPTKSNKSRNKVDPEYISDQLTTISKLWFAVLKAKRIVKPNAVILFINKLDLYDDKEKMLSEFSEHKKQLQQICNESNIKFYAISGSVLDKSGMTELMKILKQ